MKLITRNENKPGYKETKIGWIPKEWDLQPLGKIGAFSKGKGITNSQKKKSGLPCITYGEIYTKHDFIIKEFKSFIDQETAESSQLILQNDILFAGSGETLDEIGKCVTNPFTNKVFAGGDIVILTPSGNDSLFLSLLINSNYITRFRRKLGQGHSVVHIYSSGLKTLDIPLPPLPEQKKIAAILSTWDKAISNYELLIKNYELRKKGLMQKLLSGEVRFPGFTEPWKEVRLGEIGTTYSGLSGKSGKDFGTGTPFIPYLNIYQNNRINIQQFDYVIIKENENQNRVKYGDIFFTTSSETPDEVGVSSVLLDDLSEVYLNSFCFGFRLNDFEIILPKFARYYFRSDYFLKITYRLAQGATRFNLSKISLLKELLLLPPIEEQQKIASVLSDCDREIELLKKEKTALEQQKKGLMQKLLTGTVRVKPINN